MYKEITTYTVYDGPYDNKRVEENGPVLLNLNTIQVIFKNTYTIKKKKYELMHLVTGPEDAYLVSVEEGEAIKKMLLSQNEPTPQNNRLAEEVSHLTAAIRDLWNLLRARMR